MAGVECMIARTLLRLRNHRWATRRSYTRRVTPVRIATTLLLIDCVGGLVVGTLVLLFAEWLSALYVLPEDLLVTMGVANLA